MENWNLSYWINKHLLYFCVLSLLTVLTLLAVWYWQIRICNKRKINHEKVSTMLAIKDGSVVEQKSLYKWIHCNKFMQESRQLIVWLGATSMQLLFFSLKETYRKFLLQQMLENICVWLFCVLILHLSFQGFGQWFDLIYSA